MQYALYGEQQNRHLPLRCLCRCTPCGCSARTNPRRFSSAWVITCVRSSLWTTAAFAPTSTSACRARTVPTTGPRSSSTEVSVIPFSWNDSNRSFIIFGYYHKSSFEYNLILFFFYTRPSGDLFSFRQKSEHKT